MARTQNPATARSYQSAVNLGAAELAQSALAGGLSISEAIAAVRDVYQSLPGQVASALVVNTSRQAQRALAQYEAGVTQALQGIAAEVVPSNLREYRYLIEVTARDADGEVTFRTSRWISKAEQTSFAELQADTAAWFAPIFAHELQQSPEGFEAVSEAADIEYHLARYQERG